MFGDNVLLRPDGFIEITDLDGKITRQETVQCNHCGCHWVHNPGSGKIRGYCSKCNGYFCGPACAKCVPTEQLLENIEQGKPLDHRSTVVQIPYFDLK